MGKFVCNGDLDSDCVYGFTLRYSGVACDAVVFLLYACVYYVCAPHVLGYIYADGYDSGICECCYVVGVCGFSVYAVCDGLCYAPFVP